MGSLCSRNVSIPTSGSFIRNHRQFRVNVSYCDFRVNLNPLFLNLQDRRMPSGCLVTVLTVITLSAIGETVASRPRTDYQTDHRLVHPDR